MIAPPEVVIAKWLDQADCVGANSYSPATAISLVYVREARLPVEMFDIGATQTSRHVNSLDWISLSRTAMPNARPMTTEERQSVNRFFWSHFE